MLVLSRKVGERLKIGDNIEVMVTRISGNAVRLGVTAPREIGVHRGEVPGNDDPTDVLYEGDECDE